jgi:hypothetical protein
MSASTRGSLLAVVLFFGRQLANYSRKIQVFLLFLSFCKYTYINTCYMYIGLVLREPRLTVNKLLDARTKQLELEAKESGTKQPDTELTDRLDHWLQFQKDIEAVDEEKAASKAEQEEKRLRLKDRKEDMLFGLNAKRALEVDDNDDDDEGDESATNNSSSSRLSQRRALKRRREVARQQDVVVRVEADDNSMSKDDWMDVIAASNTSVEDLRKEFGKEFSSLRTTVTQLASSTERNNQLLEQFLLQGQCNRCGVTWYS